MREGDDMTDGSEHGRSTQGQEYLSMRLRTLLTGEAAPSDASWTDALGRLLAHLAANPVPGTPDDRARAFAEAWGVRIGTPPAPLDERGERERDAAAEMRLLDMGEDLLPLVHASDSPIAHRMIGRELDAVAPVPGSFVLLAATTVTRYDFAMDATLLLKTSDGSSERLVITVFGRRAGSDHEWLWADLSRRSPATEDATRERVRIAGVLHVVGGATVREKADAAASAAIEAGGEPHRSMAISQTVHPEDVVLVGDDENVAFVMPVRLDIADESGRRVVEVVHQGWITSDADRGGIEISSVSVGL